MNRALSRIKELRFILNAKEIKLSKQTRKGGLKDRIFLQNHIDALKWAIEVLENDQSKRERNRL